jgi:ADP-ribosylglycohydrolase
MTAHRHIDPDRALGAYLGAAIGDAMGGPVEGMHAARIKRIFGRIEGLLPYRKPPGLNDLAPGYALQPDPGSITDDTFIRAQFTNFYVETQPPRTPRMLADWLLANADFSMWWPPMAEPLRAIERGDAMPEKDGLSHPQGGGAGWWTPIGVLHAGDPAGAAAETRRMCTIWKAPLEQDLLAATQAGLAEALRAGATVDSMVEVMLDQCGPLAWKLLQRGLAIAHSARSGAELVLGIYEKALVCEAPTAAEAALPAPMEPLLDSDKPYASILFAEQIPLAVAAFVFAGGEPSRAIPEAVMLGRDADSIATTVGSWSGALFGESALPADWVSTVCEANRTHLDLRRLASDLLCAPV